MRHINVISMIIYFVVYSEVIKTYIDIIIYKESEFYNYTVVIQHQRLHTAINEHTGCIPVDWVDPTFFLLCIVELLMILYIRNFCDYNEMNNFGLLLYSAYCIRFHMWTLQKDFFFGNYFARKRKNLHPNTKAPGY